MRPVLAIALVMLLLVRGLLGDAMALGLAPVQPAPHMEQMAQAMDADAHHAAAMAPECCDHSGDSHMPHQGGCSACGICHSALAVPAWMATPGTGTQHSRQPPPSTRFASALAAQAIKPPIA
ncbi:MAG: hypothetical protein JSR53_07620 [Proteobacteria bacterium]|nr:hypothetical protein [Pseudomonadota bacterium]